VRTSQEKLEEPTPVTRAFAQVLKELRKERGLSQEGLGFASGLHRTYVSQIERGEKQPTIGTLFKLSAALEYDPHAVIKLVEDRLR
jgi:transcriptional regulator with XRE-family HTH domain